MNMKTGLVDPQGKTISLDDVAPKWAKRLAEEKKFPFPLSFKWFKWYFELDIPKRCVVGEAHGFSSSYEKECEECNRLGWQFGHSFIMRSRSGLDRDVRNFLQHWKDKHLSSISTGSVKNKEFCY
jgi:hypothetical protein